MTAMTALGQLLKCLLIALISSIIIQPTSITGARILGYFPAPSKSHAIIHSTIANYLAEAGHEVTVISGFPKLLPNPRYKHILVESGSFDTSFAKELVNKPKPFYQRFGHLTTSILRMANDSYSHPTMQNFLQTHGENSFDLLLLGYFMNDFHLGLAAHFKCPVIISFMIQPIAPVNAFIGNPAELAYTPTVFSSFKQPLSFRQRVLNFLLGAFERFALGPFLHYKNQELYSKHFPSDRYPDLSEMRKNVSLVFANHHHISQGPIRPNVPGLIDIGGVQIKQKSDPLPEDIASVLDNSKEGVIFFSLGSNVQADWINAEKMRILYNVLSTLPYRVLWKFSGAAYPGTSPNIVFKSWLPQDDILAHPNCKLFITHGGHGSVVESEYHGVPMVGMPLFGDQPSNVAGFVRSGFGLEVDFSTLSEDSLRSAISEVMENPKYRTAVQKFSELYRDRPMTPRQLVVYWTNYVLRHKGAKHLQSPAIHMNLIQLQSFDVIAFLLSALLIVFVITFKVFQCLCCRQKRGQTDRSVDSKKNK